MHLQQKALRARQPLQRVTATIASINKAKRKLKISGGFLRFIGIRSKQDEAASGQHAGRGFTVHDRSYAAVIRTLSRLLALSARVKGSSFPVERPSSRDELCCSRDESCCSRDE